MNVHAELERDARGHLPADGVEALRQLHRQHGLMLSFSRGSASVILNGDAGALVTELIRLADLGAAAEATARHPSARTTRVDAVVQEAATSWKRRLKP